MSTREKVIEVRGLRNQFGAQVVHDNLDLDVYRGEILGVVGGSGSGKSVLLRSIIGLNRPAAGSVEVFGQEVTKLSDARALGARAALRRAVPERRAVLVADRRRERRGAAARASHLPLALMQRLAALKIALAGLPADAGAKYPSRAFRRHGQARRAGARRSRSIPRSCFSTSRPRASIRSARPRSIS